VWPRRDGDEESTIVRSSVPCDLVAPACPLREALHTNLSDCPRLHPGLKPRAQCQ
jgi:hypothetical protein